VVFFSQEVLFVILITFRAFLRVFLNLVWKLLGHCQSVSLVEPVLWVLNTLELFVHNLKSVADSVIVTLERAETSQDLVIDTFN
jgi:hypothetical protein